MAQPSFPSLTTLDASANIDLLSRHYDVNEKKSEYGFGVWVWGRRFFRVDNNEKILYRTIFWVFSKIRLIRTEENDPTGFNALKEASERSFKQLAAPYVAALTTKNAELKLEVERIETLRAQAVNDIHDLKKAEKKLTEEVTRLEGLRAKAVEDLQALNEQDEKKIDVHAEEKNQLQMSIKTLQEQLDNLLQSTKPLQQENQQLKDKLTILSGASLELKNTSSKHLSPSTTPPQPQQKEEEEEIVTLTLPLQTDENPQPT